MSNREKQVRIASFTVSSAYKNNPGLDFVDGSFIIVGSGETSREHVEQMDSAGELVWSDRSLMPLAIGNFENTEDSSSPPLRPTPL